MATAAAPGDDVKQRRGSCLCLRRQGNRLEVIQLPHAIGVCCGWVCILFFVCSLAYFFAGPSVGGILTGALYPCLVLPGIWVLYNSYWKTWLVLEPQTWRVMTGLSEWSATLNKEGVIQDLVAFNNNDSGFEIETTSEWFGLNLLDMTRLSTAEREWVVHEVRDFLREVQALTNDRSCMQQGRSSSSIKCSADSTELIRRTTDRMDVVQRPSNDISIGRLLVLVLFIIVGAAAISGVTWAMDSDAGLVTVFITSSWTGIILIILIIVCVIRLPNVYPSTWLVLEPDRWHVSSPVIPTAKINDRALADLADKLSTAHTADDCHDCHHKHGDLASLVGAAVVEAFYQVYVDAEYGSTTETEYNVVLKYCDNNAAAAVGNAAGEHNIKSVTLFGTRNCRKRRIMEWVVKEINIFIADVKNRGSSASYKVVNIPAATIAPTADGAKDKDKKETNRTTEAVPAIQQPSASAHVGGAQDVDQQRREQQWRRQGNNSRRVIPV